MAGGFMPEPTSSSSARPASKSEHASGPTPPAPARPLRKLTPKQEERLRSWLDDAFLKLERGFARRTDPGSPISTLLILLSHLEPILSLILSIPPIDPTTYLRTSALLNLTSVMREMIVGYFLPTTPLPSAPANPAHPPSLDQPSATAARTCLDTVLILLEDLDAGWQLVLRGEVYDPSAPGGARSREGSWREGTAGFAPAVGGASGSGGRQTLLGREMSMTDKIRLRSSILSLRSKLLDWIEPQMHPLYPNRASATAKHATTRKAGRSNVESASEAEEEMDEVDVPSRGTVPSYGRPIKLEASTAPINPVKVEEPEDYESNVETDDTEDEQPGENGDAPDDELRKDGMPNEVQARIVGIMNGTLAMLTI